MVTPDNFICCDIPGGLPVALSGQQTLVELHASRTNEVCTMYIEELILVDIWIHCCASWSEEHWKYTGFYTLATKD